MKSILLNMVKLPGNHGHVTLALPLLVVSLILLMLHRMLLQLSCACSYPKTQEVLQGTRDRLEMIPQLVEDLNNIYKQTSLKSQALGVPEPATCSISHQIEGSDFITCSKCGCIAQKEELSKILLHQKPAHRFNKSWLKNTGASDEEIENITAQFEKIKGELIKIFRVRMIRLFSPTKYSNEY